MEKNLEKFIGEDNLLKISKLSDKMQKKTIKLYKIAKKKNIKFNIASGLRTYSEQKELFDKYFHIYGPKKVSIPGYSEHERGLAIDITVGNNLSYHAKYKYLGKIWESLGGVWGGNTIDEYWHFEIIN